MRVDLRSAALLVLTLATCKVPITDIKAAFTLADAAWFEQEQTLFVFWRLEAQQGLESSQIELTYRTDDVEQPWHEITSLPQVHTHLPVDCGLKGRCGSASVKVEKTPRDVAIRLRYHKDGEVFLDTETVFNVVGTGAPQTNRSLIVYGVFDESNRRVQWRERHVFPTLRNEDVSDLGLRRSLSIRTPQAGDVSMLPPENPYGYGVLPTCPSGLAALGWAELKTQDRAAFAPETMPLSASTASGLCARAIVTDGTGTFETVAIARKNPEVRPAFPSLRSPVRDAVAVGFVLAPCNRVISAAHRDMQVQRLQLEGKPVICIDDVHAPGFAMMLAGQFQNRLDEVRAQGDDMVLVIALHHDDTTGFTTSVLEDALEQVVPPEKTRATPRVVGAFVFDGYAYKMKRMSLQRTVLWCPARFATFVFDGGFEIPVDGGLDDSDLLPDNAQQTCALLPDPLELMLGPFKFSALPILPSRAQYLTFIDKYSVAQAGRTTKLGFKAPERTPTSRNVDFGDFGVATFFNNESISAAPTDAFSYCNAGPDAGINTAMFSPPIAPQLALSIPSLPEVHQMFPQPSYELGLGWDFPFLTTLDYETMLAGAATAFSVSVPFGFSGKSTNGYGSAIWLQTSLPLDRWLKQCTRFCDHPTFGAGGVYEVTRDFRSAYAQECYQPLYPALDGGGFPIDP